MFIAHPLLLESYYVAQAILEFSLLAKAEITEETLGYVQFWCTIASWARSHSAGLHRAHCVLCDLGIAFRQSQTPVKSTDLGIKLDKFWGPLRLPTR